MEIRAHFLVTGADMSEGVTEQGFEGTDRGKLFPQFVLSGYKRDPIHVAGMNFTQYPQVSGIIIIIIIG